MGGVFNAISPPGKKTSTHVQEAGWVLGPVWMGAENLLPIGI